MYKRFTLALYLCTFTGFTAIHAVRAQPIPNGTVPALFTPAGTLQTLRPQVGSALYHWAETFGRRHGADRVFAIHTHSSDGLARGEQFTLTLGDGRSWLAEPREIRHRDGGAYALVVTLHSEYGLGRHRPARTDYPDEAVFYINGDRITGSVNTAEAFYQIYAVGNGDHVVVKWAWEDLPEADPLGNDRADLGTWDSTRTDVPYEPTCDPTDADAECPEPWPPYTPPGEPTPTPSYTVDVLVAYTPAATTAVPNVTETIYAAEEETNLVFRNSSLPRFQINVVGIVGVNYQERTPDGWNDAPYPQGYGDDSDLRRFARQGDGYMDEIHAQREGLGADLVILLTGDGYVAPGANTLLGYADGVGAGQPNGSGAEHAFALVVASFATAGYTFAHELGHIIGLRHSNDNDVMPYAEGHGLRVAGEFRTVLGNGGGERRIPYWSNPAGSYNGHPLGTTTFNNAYAALRQAFSITAGLRTPPGGDGEIQRGLATALAGAGEQASPSLELSIAPNPARGLATLQFALPESATINLTLHDVLGREVLRLPGAEMPGGPHRLPLDVSSLPPGLYVCRLQAGSHVATTTLVVGR